MRTLKLTELRKLEVLEEPIPQIGDDEVIVKVKRCGICGSDVAGYLGVSGRRYPPMTMGHEFSGVIEQIGSRSGGFQKGDRVTVQPWNACGKCRFCKEKQINFCKDKRALGVLDTNGAMAEYVKTTVKQLFRLPENLSFEEAAFTEPFAVAYGAVKRAGDLKDKVVAIVGAGTIALCILQIVKTKEPKHILVLDRKDVRLQTAARYGADILVNTSEGDVAGQVSEVTGGEMADVAFEAVGVQDTAQLSLKCLHPGAKAVWVGMSQTDITIDMQQVVQNAFSIIGSFNYTSEEFGEALEILAGGQIDGKAMITKTIGLDQVQETMEDMHANSSKYIKVMIDPERS